MKCGGIHEALKINQICETAGIECMIGCMAEETTIGITAAAHLAAAQKNIKADRCDIRFRNCARNWGRILRSKTIIGIRRSSWIRHFSLKRSKVNEV